jgi:hypothetical protein
MTDYFFQQGTVIIISTTLVLLTLLLNVVYRDISGVKLYALGALMLQLSMLMFLSPLSKQGYLPVLIFANLGFIIAVTLQLEGIAAFFGEQERNKSMLFIAFLLSISYVYVTAIDLNTDAQILIMNFGVSIFYIKMFFMFLSTVSKQYLTSKIFFIPALVFSLSILMARGLNVLLPNGLALTDFTNKFLSEGAFFITSLFVVGFFILAAEYQKKQLSELNQKISSESEKKTLLLKFINHEVRNHLGSISIKTDLMKHNENYLQNVQLMNDIDLISQINDELEKSTTDIMERSDYKKP